jgi:hypothetical protein
MKTIRLTISIALVALATAAVGQKSSIKERLFPNRSHEVYFVNADFKVDNDRMISFMDEVLGWTSPLDHIESYEAPEATRTFHMDQVEVIIETEPAVESWMSNPFENEVYEEFLDLESWMTTSFESNLYDHGPALEAWMTTPFEGSLSEEAVTLENWMTTSFEYDLSEQELTLESWMSTPFESELSEEPLYVEDWMTNPFEIENTYDEEPIEMESWMVSSWK